MKSVFNKIDKEKSKDIEFPVLAEALVYGETFVVLFLSDSRGIIVKGNRHNTVGFISNGYSIINHPSRWRTLSPEESIVLSND